MRGELLLLLADGLAILCITRCLLHWAQLDAAHPLHAFSRQTTEWLVKPLRKAAPNTEWDGASLLAAALLYYVVYMLMTWLSLPEGFSLKLVGINILFTLLAMLKAAAYVLLIGLVIRMLLSFQAPYSMLNAALHRIYTPLLKPFAFLRIGRYDFSGSLLALALWWWLSAVLPQLTSRINLWLLQ